MRQALNALLVSALVLPLIFLTGCCDDPCYDKTGTHGGDYNKYHK